MCTYYIYFYTFVASFTLFLDSIVALIFLITGRHFLVSYDLELRRAFACFIFIQNNPTGERELSNT